MWSIIKNVTLYNFTPGIRIETGIKKVYRCDFNISVTYNFQGGDFIELIVSKK